MVATRKSSSTQPQPPMASRTNSTTSSPKVKPRKSGNLAGSSSASSIPPAPGVAVAGNKDPVRPEFADPPKVIGSSPLKNTLSKTPEPSPSRAVSKNSKKRAAASKPPRHPTSKPASRVMKAVRNVILATFIAHTVLVCPFDEKLESVVCSTVHDFHHYFNHYIFEPHLQPQFHNLITHPSVAPYAQPVLHHTSSLVARVAPIVAEAGSRANTIYLQQLDRAGKAIHQYSGPYVKQVHQYYDTSVHPLVDKHLLPPYKAYVLPTVQQLDKYGKIAGMRAEPYLHHAVVVLQEGGRKVQPHALVLAGYAAQLPGLLRQHAWEPLVDIRRTYVDPPISKIMETVEEVGGEAKAATTSKFMAHARETPGEQQVFEGAPTSEESLDETVPSDASSSTEPPHSTMTDADAGPITPEPHVRTASESTTGAEAGPDDEDLDAFLRELGADEVGPEPEAVPEEPQHTESPEEAEERRRLKDLETAEKRADIARRHAEWEEKVKALTATQIAALPEIIQNIRSEAVAELTGENYPEMMQKDADRALKNTEAFVKKLLADSSNPEDKSVLLENLVNKVKKKFEDGAVATNGDIKTWWEGVREEEGSAVEKLVKEVNDLGTIAQGDLGLDYAWLDDVTVNDWARYHDLVGAANDLEKKLTDMVLGVDQDSPENALSDALGRLQVDLETVVQRFQNSLSDAHKKGLDAIRGRQTDSSGTSSLAQPEPASTDASAEEPTYSILPIEDPVQPNIANQHIFLEKGKEQVEDALRMAHEAELQEAASLTSADSVAATTTAHVEL